MEFGVEKCTKITFKRGKLIHSQNVVININREIQELEQVKTYKYLGIEESEGIQHQQMKERLKEEYRRRLRMILKSELKARNKITATGALAVPVLRYSFGIINWRIEEIKQIDRKTSRMLTFYKMHHPKADIYRLYVKRKERERGLVQVEAAYKAEIINIAEYLNTNYKEDQFVNVVKSRESAQPNMNSIIKSAAKILEELTQLKKHWYELVRTCTVPKSVDTNKGGKVTILWNQQVQTDRTIPNNKPDIIIRDNEKRTCMLIDVAISGDRNVIKKEAEKILRYKDLTIKIQRTRNVKTRVIPVVIGATGIIAKSFRKYVSNISGNREVTRN
jgi:hypothetical protein